jgi:hypothetical protein
VRSEEKTVRGRTRSCVKKTKKTTASAKAAFLPQKAAHANGAWGPSVRRNPGRDQLPLFQPSAETGLTSEIARGATKYLDGKTNQDMRSNRLERLLQNVKSVVQGHQG